MEQRTVLVILGMCLYGAPLWLSWWLFLSADGVRVSQSRRVLTIVGLSGISLSFFAFVGMMLHSALIGGLYDQPAIYRAWAQPGFILALISPWLVLTAVGWSRVIGFAAGVVAFFVWLASAAAM